jgi:peptidoglycan/xylan/chitin deacetylase (PgdA/CDA1 family)
MQYPVLAYHKVSEQWELSFTMLYPKQFEKQMRFLAKKGYIGKSLKSYLEDPQDHYFVLTFDDAYDSVYENAFPLLQELGFTATIFVLTNYMGKRNTWDFTPGKIYSTHMPADRLIALHKAGWEIASHGENHRVMTHMKVDIAKQELKKSKEVLESILQAPIDTFCFPFGSYNEKTVNIALSAGYKHLVGFTEASKFGVITRSAVYRVVDNKYSVLRKVRRKPLSMLFEHIKEGIFHSFSLLSRLKQRLFSNK